MNELTYREQDKHDMLEFFNRHGCLHSIANDSRTRRAALSLENDGKLVIIRHGELNWQAKKID